MSDNPYEQFHAAAENPYARFHEKPKRPKEKGFWGQVGDTITSAASNLAEGVRKDAQAYTDQSRNPPDNPLAALRQQAGNMARTGRTVVDAVGTALSPLAGVQEAAIVKPGARALSAVTPGNAEDPEGTQEQWEGNIRTALMAARPAPAGPRLPLNEPRPGGLPETVQRFDRAGVQPSLAAAAGRGSAATTNAIAENPLAGVAVRPRLQARVAEVQDAATRTAGRYGAPRGKQLAGEDIQTGVQRFAKGDDPAATVTTPTAHTTFEAKAGALYDDAFGRIPNQPVTPAATSRALGDALSRINAPNLAGVIKNPKIQSIADALRVDHGQVTFSDLRELRSWVRKAQKDPGLRGDINTADLQRLEGALTEDIFSAADTLGGPEAATKLRRADQYYAAGQQRIRTALQPFADAKSGESAYARLMQAAGSTSGADVQRVIALKRSLSPEEWGDIAATTIDEMGRPAKGAADAAEAGAFSLDNFVSNYAAMSPRARQVLFGSVGGGGRGANALKAELDNLVSVAGDLKALQKGANASKSGVSMQTAGTLTGLGYAASRAAVGDFAPLGAAAAGLSGLAVTGEVLTNPAAVRLLASFIKASRTSRAAAANVAAGIDRLSGKNPAFLPLSEAVNQALRGSGQSLAPPGIVAAEDQEQKER